MKNRKDILLWIARGIIIFSIIFFGIFASDAITEDATFWNNVLGFVISLAPSLILLLVLLSTWKKSQIAGALFLILSLISVIFFNTYEHIYSFLLVTCPILISSIFFFIYWKVKDK